jgi:crotonobetaine/carnitine-CoA ligase
MVRMSEALIEAGIVPLLRNAAQREGDRVFSRFEGVPLTIEALHRQSDALAAGLRRRRLARGARAAVMLRNGPAALAAMFGLAKAGIVWVPVNVRLRGNGLRYVLAHSSPHLIIADADLLDAIRASGADLAGRPLLTAGGSAGDPLEPILQERAAFDEPPPDGRAPFAISYTSGTTGTPKGVIVTHRMLRFAGEGAALASGARDGDVLLVWEPLYHIGGSQLIVLPLITRAALAMVGRFSAARFWQDARDCGATHVHYLGGVLQMLLKQPPGPLDRGHGVRVAWGGGCPPDVRRACRERFGVAIRECYGMTEASSITTYDAAATAATVGRPVPWFAVEVRAADGRPLGPGERGEITVRERQRGALFPGYFRDPEASAAALRDGELRTGDVGSFDREGNLIFHGRATDSVRP